MEILAFMHCIHFCVIHFIIQNEFKDVVHTDTHTRTHTTSSQVGSNKLFSLFYTLKLKPELKTTKGRQSAVMYISNRAYLSTT